MAGKSVSIALGVMLLVSVRNSHASETCRLGDAFVVLPPSEVLREGDLVEMMTKSGSVTLDSSGTKTSYDVTITYRVIDPPSVHKYKGSSAVTKTTKKPDDNWMCELPKCAKKDVLETVLRELKVDSSAVDTVEFLAFDMQRDRHDGSRATEDDPDIARHDIVRFLGNGKVLGGGMYFQVMYSINFWPCR